MSGAGRMPDPSVAVRTPDPAKRGRGVELVRQLPGGLCGTAVTECRESIRERGVHLGAMLGLERRGFADEEGSSPFADRARGESAEGMRHLGDERPRQTEVAAAAMRGVPSSKCHLGRHSAAALRCRDAGCGLLGALRGIERDRQARLGGCNRSLQRLQPRDQVDALAVGVGTQVAAESVDDRVELGDRRHCVLHWFTLRSPVAAVESNVCSRISWVRSVVNGRSERVEYPCAGCRLNRLQW